MRLPLSLLVVSLTGAAFGWVTGGPTGDAAFLIGIVSAVAAGVLAITGIGRPPLLVIVDGSNVMFWRKGAPSLQTVADVVAELRDSGLTPVVWFDANVGYKVGARYMGSAPLARSLGLPTDDVRVAPKGVPADPLILAYATRVGARVVTNDRFRDWSEDYPAVETDDFLIRGRARGGRVSLKL